MRTMKVQWMILATMVLLGMALPQAGAATKQELQQRFAQRFPQIRQYKSQGLIGETAAGYVEAVKGDLPDAARQLMDQENADRRELYALIATETKTTPETVAKNNALRNFQKAQKGDWLKGEDGAWKQKA